MVSRRRYLLGCTAGLASLTGCAADPEISAEPLARELEKATKPLSPDLRVTETASSEGRLIEMTASGSTYTAEIENEGIEGTILTELYFRADGTTASTPAASQETMLDAGERAELSVTADRPPWAEQFGFVTRGTRFVATIRNTGSAADVRVFMVDPVDETTITETTVQIDADETKRVDFHTTYKFDNDYEIRAVLA